jgi:alcohol dehydrogenase (cytochrome c)
VVLDAKTGAYSRHFSVVPHDFHDWDVSAPPALVTTRGGRRLMAVTPKDGRLYGYDLASSAQLYATPITTIENDKAPLTAAGTRFCPGSQGGSEWNGPSYSPQSNLVYTGSVDWCVTVQVAPPEKVAATPVGQSWAGTPQGDFGKFDPKDRWGGWVTATDADSGAVRWRFRTDAPVLAGVTSTAGGLVFTADMGGNAYGLDAASGAPLWRDRLDGAAGGGVITYMAGGQQYVAFIAGTNSPIWPVDKKTAKIVVYSLAP